MMKFRREAGMRLVVWTKRSTTFKTAYFYFHSVEKGFKKTERRSLWVFLFIYFIQNRAWSEREVEMMRFHLFWTTTKTDVPG